MTEAKPTGTPPRPGEVAEELRNLGKNLKDILVAMWESEERKRVQDEIEKGLNDLGSTLNEAAAEFNQSPTGQRIKSDVEDLRQRMRNGEMEATLRSELLNALRMANEELGKANARRAAKQPPETGPDQKDTL